MKFTVENQKIAAMEYFTKPLWRDMYNNASPIVKKRLLVAFWASKYLDEHEDLDAYRKRREEIEKCFTYEDAAYLAERFPKGAGKDHYTELRDKLQTKSLRTVEKLDEALEIMMEGCSDYERDAVLRTQKIFKKIAAKPLFDYSWVWSAYGGNGDDCEMLGDVFDHGHEVEVDEGLAWFWFHKGALSGDGNCCCRLAEIYEDEKSPRFDMDRSMFWFREALRRNNKLVKCDLGARLTVLDIPSWESRRNPELGIKLLTSALKTTDDGRAHYFLGKCYKDGVGVKRDLIMAIELLEEASKHDLPCATEELKQLKEKK